MGLLNLSIFRHLRCCLFLVRVLQEVWYRVEDSPGPSFLGVLPIMERFPGNQQLFVRVFLIMSIVGLPASHSLFVRVIPIAGMEGCS